MCVKGRVPTLRYVTRTHRVDLDWIIERIKTDTGISMKYVKTSEQLADMLTKASFAAPLWKTLLKLHQIGVHRNFSARPQPEPMFFAMLSVSSESGEKSHKCGCDLPQSHLGSKTQKWLLRPLRRLLHDPSPLWHWITKRPIPSFILAEAA